MKNINKVFGIVAFGTLVLTSCGDTFDKFLDVAQYDKVDVEGEFLTEEGALAGLTGVYDLMNPNDGPDGDWGFKPNLFSGTHPTMDTQATGWDAVFNSQNWSATTTELASGWAHAYAAIARANVYLAGLEKAPKAGVTYNEKVDNKGDITVDTVIIEGTGISDKLRQTATGEARAVRGFFYTYLAQTFGRVPMLNTGEDYNTHRYKERAATYNEMWDFIIDDFKTAADLLDWKPYQGQYGRATKGMAKAYLADAYLWKAYRLGCDLNGVYQESQASTNAAEIRSLYEKAENELREIINSGTYKLSPSFCTNWDVDGGGWNEECIWALLLDENDKLSGYVDRVSSMNIKWYVACPENGGWGSLYLSWEWYAAYEQGDKRRDASCIIGGLPYDDLKKLYKYANKSNIDAINKIPELQEEYDEKLKDLKDVEAAFEDAKAKLPKDNPDYKAAEQAVTDAQKAKEKAKEALNKVYLFNHGYHPFLQCNVGKQSVETQTKQFHYTNGEWAPAIWSAKLWRNASAETFNGVGAWGTLVWCPTNIYWKRYSNVLLDFAECRFFLHGGDDQEGWDAIQQIRDRAFGKNEKGLDDSKYLPWINTMAETYHTSKMSEYPIPFDQDGLGAPDAKTYYTQYAKCNIKGKAFTSPVWKVAVNEERRKEFSCEWCLRPDLQRSGYLRDHIETNYPMDATSGEALKNYPWSPRQFEYNEMKMDMPIPADEIAKNPLCKQNPAYSNAK